MAACPGDGYPAGAPRARPPVARAAIADTGAPEQRARRAGEFIREASKARNQIAETFTISRRRRRVQPCDRVRQRSPQIRCRCGNARLASVQFEPAPSPFTCLCAPVRLSRKLRRRKIAGVL